MKKIALLLISMLVALLLAGCTVVNQDNSFQNTSTQDTAAVQQAQETTQPDAAQPDVDVTEAPNTDPNASGYNG